MKNIKADTHIHMGCRTIGSDKYNWQSVELKSFKAPQTKMFFVFGGNSTNYPEAANGNAKVVERLLSEDHRNKSNIYSFMYDGEPISPKTKYLFEEYKEEIHNIFETIFKPMFLDNVGNLKEKQGIEKVLKNLVFVSHCGGSNFVNIIIDDIYNLLTEKYHQSIANQLINKLQHFAYAPLELPNRSISGFIVAPFLDNDCSWGKVLDALKGEKIYTDYPKGITKNLFKAQDQGTIIEAFDEIFKDQRMIIFRSNQNIYLIPSRINSNFAVGDHSIDCLVKKNVLEADTDYAKTARVLNYASKLALNQFASHNSLDHRYTLDKITTILNHKPNKTDHETEADTTTF